MNFIYLLIEFLDELVFGVGEIALPLIRDDLQLTYTQIGLLLSLPGIIAAFIEPLIGILGDVGKRRRFIITGGVFFMASLCVDLFSVTFSSDFPSTISARQTLLDAAEDHRNI